VGIPVPLVEFVMYQKTIKGALYGMMSPSKDVHRLLGMYETGQLKLDELVTRKYKLEDINQGYRDLHSGINMRGIVEY
jgi:S-(hydroxymethyl)glutathione dehydrogenase/alcohol dehydrogenase